VLCTPETNLVGERPGFTKRDPRRFGAIRSRRGPWTPAARAIHLDQDSRHAYLRPGLMQFRQ
jgi:hypothetical protein